jgi:hypothetical protein
VAAAAPLPEAGRNLALDLLEGGRARRLGSHRIESSPGAIEKVHAREEGGLGLPRIDLPRIEAARKERVVAQGELEARETFLLGLEHRHLDLLRRHRRHVTGLIAGMPLRGRLPLA